MTSSVFLRAPSWPGNIDAGASQARRVYHDAFGSVKEITVARLSASVEAFEAGDHDALWLAVVSYAGENSHGVIARGRRAQRTYFHRGSRRRGRERLSRSGIASAVQPAAPAHDGGRPAHQRPLRRLGR